MTDSDVVDALGRGARFEELDPEPRAELADHLRRETVVPGEPIWSPGEAGTGAYLLLDGRVEITWRSQPEGRDSVQYDSAGEWFGLPYVVDEWEHESAASPRERTELAVLDRETFLELFDQGHPGAYAALERAAVELVDEVRDANRRLADVFGRPAETLQMLRRRSRD
ncbi:MAG: Crp/Fnr family transcriptional regulator [Bradymonadaceae bacterium]